VQDGRDRADYLSNEAATVVVLTPMATVAENTSDGEECSLEGP
jgi:hypothetical protein